MLILARVFSMGGRMEKDPETGRCRRCGEEISKVESVPSTDDMCGLCRNMQLEASQVQMQKRINSKSILTLVHPTKRR